MAGELADGLYGQARRIRLPHMGTEYQESRTMLGASWLGLLKLPVHRLW